MQKQANFHIRGMQRDLSLSKFNPEFVYDAQNIRITARDNNTLLSVTNERGTKEITLKDSSKNSITIEGTIIGYDVLNKYVIFFTVGDTDRIYRLENKGDYFEVILLFSGDLNLSVESPIESIGIYENENIQKVYWVDGRNQPRVINITAKDSIKDKWTSNSFNFVQELELRDTITVERQDIANGEFAPGVIQYAFSYYNLYGQESNIFHVSPLQYISFANRGASPEEKVSCGFNINIKNYDTNFDYIRIYSIHRTSLDATPTVLNVADLPITGTSDINYIDNGTTGVVIDPTELLYIGGQEIISGTITQKDNTLFLGNNTLSQPLVPKESIKDKVYKGTIGFGNNYVGNYVNPVGYYPYHNSLYLGSKIKSFKYLEWYRFGLQFQYKTGKWSEPVYVNDSYNNRAVPIYEDSLSSIYASYIIPKTIIDKAVEAGFKKVRGIVVHPSLKDREVVAQGILCPTVYNVGDRFGNSPFAQASWFSRPSMSFDIEKNKSNFNPFDVNDINNSKGAVIANENIYISNLKTSLNVVNKGAWAEFRHNYPIPNNWERNAEIQCLANVATSPFSTSTGNDLYSEVMNNKECFFIDQSIVTFHSPDIEFNNDVKNIDTSDLKLRIVGVAAMTGNASDIDIQTSTPANDVDKLGFYKEIIGSENISTHGLKSLVSGAYWFDKLTDMINVDDDHGYTESFYVYAWHRNGSLNNSGNVENRTAVLKHKKLSNLKFSAVIKYFRNPWLAYIEGDNNHTGITPISIFNSNEVSMVRIPSPKNSGLGELTYYGNIDKVLSPTRYDKPYNVTKEFKKGESTTEFKTESFNKKNGYPITVGGVGDAKENSHFLFTQGPLPLQFVKNNEEGTISKTLYGTDPVSIKYKSTPHAVFALNYTRDGKQVILPTNMEKIYAEDNWSVNVPDLGGVIGGSHFFWNPKAKEIRESPIIIEDSIYQDIIEEYSSTAFENNYGYLFLAELYRDNVNNRFGGESEEAIEFNQWIPAGEPIILTQENGKPISDSSITVMYTEGDTFLARYDCLKTYPFTLEDQNSVTDIVSFMCETRVNIEGRYDKNRGQVSNLTTIPENFNKINDVYSQKNNFFNYRGIDPKKYSIEYFPNTITWTKEKQLGETIDTWTNVTMASTIDLDGNKGEIISLNTFNNEIYCFQRKGLSNILFNSRVQIPTSDGVPIEITNGLKVGGKRYISNSIGCDNKWSIVESPSGIYFIDSETNSLYLFNGKIQSLSDKLGFRQWFSEHITSSNWNPEDYDNFRTFYDKNNGDVYFVNKDVCLCYSEFLNQFTSFMSYENVSTMFNIGSEFYSFNKNKLWQNFTGDYNMFYGEFKPYSITLVANPDEPYDKVFNTIDFRADSWDENNLTNETFDTLDVWNEYQHGTTTLTNSINKPSSLKKKFRIWRAIIPRDNSNKRDRIRNTWAYIKLSKNKPNKLRTELHDINVQYFI